MNPVPAAISAFLRAHHVVGLAVCIEGEPWAASCFYAWDEDAAALLVMSESTTRHAQGMAGATLIAGTVAGQPRALSAIKGLQFRARAHRLGGAALDAALARYCRRHPVARLKPAPLWQLELLEMKYTDNLLGFGHKTQWQRGD